MVAAKNGNVGMVKALLGVGVSKLPKNVDKKLAEELTNSSEIAQLIRDYAVCGM